MTFPNRPEASGEYMEGVGETRVPISRVFPTGFPVFPDPTPTDRWRRQARCWVSSRAEVSEHLVGSAAFKAVGTGDPRPAGSIPVHLRQRVHGRPPRTVEIALTRAFVQGRRWTFVDVRGALLSGLLSKPVV